MRSGNHEPTFYNQNGKSNKKRSLDNWIVNADAWKYISKYLFIIMETKMNYIRNEQISYGVSGKVRLKGIHQNFPFALQRRVNPQHLTKMLRLPLQSEIKTSDNTLTKRNFLKELKGGLR